MKKNLSFILALVVLVSATGCQQATTSEIDQPGFHVEQPSFATYMAPNAPSGGEGRIIAERLYDTAVKPMRDLQNQYEAGVITADKLDEEARGIIAKASNDEDLASLAAQSVSHRTLSILVHDEDASEDAIAHHVNVLVEHRSPHAEVIAEALDVLEDHWTDEQIKTTAAKAVDNAEAWLSTTDERIHTQGKERTAISSAAKSLAQ